jgi:hypothetical protein
MHFSDNLDALDCVTEEELPLTSAELELSTTLSLLEAGCSFDSEEFCTVSELAGLGSSGFCFWFSCLETSCSGAAGDEESSHATILKAAAVITAIAILLITLFMLFLLF